MLLRTLIKSHKMTLAVAELIKVTNLTSS